MARITDYEPLLPAEETLIQGLSSGDVVEIGDGGLPPEAGAGGREIRAVVLRGLILGAFDDLASYGDHGARLHEKGVRLAGAWISGGLDLEAVRIDHDIALVNCRFEAAPVLRFAALGNLALSGSALPGLDADGLEARGGVFLHDVEAVGEVRLLGAKLGGNLECVGAWFTGTGGGAALAGDGLEVRGDVVLDGAQTAGGVRLLGAKLGGDLDCDGAQFTGGADGRALGLDGAVVEGAVFLRAGARVKGVLNLTGARVGMLVDAAESWPTRGDLRLNRFSYGAFTGTAPVDAQSRIDWLDRQGPICNGDDFWPQPWEHCARVLREMGHRDDARKVLIAKEKRQRKAARVRAWRAQRVRPVVAGAAVGVVGGLAIGVPFGVVAGGVVFAALALLIGLGWWRWLKDFILAITVRYGHVPLLAFVWLAGFLAFGTLVFDAAAERDAIKPNSSRMFRAVEWTECAPGQVRNDGTSQLACYRAQDEAVSFPGFSPMIYSADTLLPIVDLEMQGYWIPDDKIEPWGLWARRYLWLQIFAGWALSLLAVAGFSGLIRTDSK